MTSLKKIVISKKTTSRKSLLSNFPPGYWIFLPSLLKLLAQALKDRVGFQEEPQALKLPQLRKNVLWPPVPGLRSWNPPGILRNDRGAFIPSVAHPLWAVIGKPADERRNSSSIMSLRPQEREEKKPKQFIEDKLPDAHCQDLCSG